MSKYLKGSEWRRWELHIHTPGTLKNDQYTGHTIEEKWDLFYTDIATYIGGGPESTKNITALGITDYLSVENYKRIIAENRLPSTVKLVLPNVEIRMYPLSKQSGINIHFIFEPSIVAELDDRFFSQLSITHRGRNFTATKNQLIQLGKVISPELNDATEAYKKGVGQFIPSFDIIKGIFDKDIQLREKTIVVVSNSSNDGVTGAANHSCYFNATTSSSDFDATRQSIYQFADAIFSSNQSDIDYFTGKGTDSKDVVINKCGCLKPCIHGCDAHINSKIFEPTEQRYCWIKSDPTFNGLRQILYEPEERVRISALKPEEKQHYYVIDRVEIDDPAFQKQPIFFNDKLTCIIGGKSTGKSILLHNLALSIDKKQVEDKIGITKSNVKIINTIKTYWADGEQSSNTGPTNENHKIVYIPQTYLNRLSDENEEVTEIDKIIQEIILINSDAKKVYNHVQEAIKNYKPILDKSIYDLLEEHKKLADIEAVKKELGTESGIIKEIKNLQSQKDLLSKELSLSAENIKSYDDAVVNIRTLTAQLGVIKQEISSINSIDSLVTGKVFDEYFSDTTLADIIKATEDAIELANQSWKTSKSVLIEKLNKIKTEIEEKKAGYVETEQLLHDMITSNEAITELTKLIHIETEKLDLFKRLDSQYHTINENYNTLLSRIVNSMQFYRTQHKHFANTINQNTNLSKNDLEFSVDYPFRKDAFCEKIKQISDKRKLKTILDLDSFEQNQYTTKAIFSLVSSILNGKLPLVRNITIETALREILSDWYNTTYSVKMDGDSIEVMSPGKKALVLLKLLISLANSKCPILIDQPEDDLDNRSIFDDLIPFIKEKKKERQIIIVTHNANILLGSDSEEVIIANQRGNNSPNKEFRFEYRTGSIEDNQPCFSEDGKIQNGILSSQGIQQHICDILEGGKKAFDLRKHKYHI